MRKFLMGWMIAVWVCFGVGWLVMGELPDGRARAYFLDVGQGDAMLLKLPHGGNVLIDAGPGSNISEPLRRAMGWLGRHIDLVVVTHFDRDHCEGLLKVLRDYSVGHILITGVEQRTELQGTLFSFLAERGIPVWIADAASDFVLDYGDADGRGQVMLDVMWPLESMAGKYVKSANETSIVARILVGTSRGQHNVLNVDSKILMTGDIGFETENKLVARYGKSGELRAEILKVPHHGSRHSSGEEFLRRVRATLAVISVSARNTYGHPHPDALGRLGDVLRASQILRTDQQGTIEMEI